MQVYSSTLIERIIVYYKGAWTVARLDDLNQAKAGTMVGAGYSVSSDKTIDILETKWEWFSIEDMNPPKCPGSNYFSSTQNKCLDCDIVNCKKCAG